MIKLYITLQLLIIFINGIIHPELLKSHPEQAVEIYIILRNVVLLQKQPQPSALLWSVRQNTNAPQWGKISR